jgi:hydroxymethylglutaryl-CoA synthase
MTTNNEFGISAIGLAIPSYGLPLQELAKIRNTDATKFIDGLGCEVMALCNSAENVVTLALKAVQRALDNWGGKLEDIGLVVAATESSIDMSRPLSSWVMQELNLKGNIRSYEVKHACYGGTVALRQALEWKISGNSKNKVALVVAADVALYAQDHSGEPTQGAGAVAFIIGEPNIASINPISYYWSESQYDFWRPVGDKYPEVNGRLSLTCYINAMLNCFTQIAPKHELQNYLQEYNYICCHVPFPKMVHKAFAKLGQFCNIDPLFVESLYLQRVYATMDWNRKIGNSYTASLWFAVANALTKMQGQQQLLAFSYGSGCGAEILTLKCVANQQVATWVRQLEQDLTQRTIIDAAHYLEIRKSYDSSL